MADKIAALFTQHIPSAPSAVASNIASGLQTYHTAYKAIRDLAMNYEMLPEYQTNVYIIPIQKDQFWPYTPHFRKFMALAIQELFKTKISHFAMSAIAIEQTLVFIDTAKNRWIVRVENSTADHNKISMYFPLSDTILGVVGKATPLEFLTDSAMMKDANLGIMIELTDGWNTENDTCA
jgi:hypothetical protein